MDIDNLVKMANRIGDFFEAMPEHDEARDGVADHIARFWEARMRAQIMAHVDAGGSGLHPLVLEALRRHRDRLAAAPAAAQG